MSTAKLENYKRKCKKLEKKTAFFMDVTNTKRQHLLPHCMLSMNSSSSCDRRLATALAHAYNVIEMCAPAAPHIRLPIQTRTLNPNPRTHPNPNPILTLTRTVFFKENKTTPEYRST